MSAKAIEVNFGGKDQISVEGNRVEFRGCFDLHRVMQNYRKSFGNDPKAWPLPSGNDHVAMLVRELILKSQGQWTYPYQEDEICHCRNVPTKTVDEAVLCGADTTAKVSRMTSASTACGTCRKDVEQILKFRLQA